MVKEFPTADAIWYIGKGSSRKYVVSLFKTTASSCSLQESENTDVPEHIASLVNFDPKVKDQKHTKISRDVTPFPKELHSKAMQWRATRDILIGGEGVANAEGGVTMRTQSAKRGQDRNSLLKAFANPLEVSKLHCITQ